MADPKSYHTEGRNFLPVMAKVLQLGPDNVTVGFRRKGRTMDGPCWVVALASGAAAALSTAGGETEWEFDFVFPCPGSPGCPE